MIGYTPYVPPETNATLTTPAPVYAPADFKATAWPDTIPSSHKLRARNAAVRARKAYPGCVGLVLEDALISYAELGYLARADHPLHQLIAELMDEPRPPAP